VPDVEHLVVLGEARLVYQDQIIFAATAGKIVVVELPEIRLPACLGLDELVVLVLARDDWIDGRDDLVIGLLPLLMLWREDADLAALDEPVTGQRDDVLRLAEATSTPHRIPPPALVPDFRLPIVEGRNADVDRGHI